MKQRIKLLFSAILLVMLGITARLFYWQIIKAPKLEKEALKQHVSQTKISPQRGAILSSDGFPLVFNEPKYTLTAYTPNLKKDPEKVADLVLDNISFEIDDPEIATDSAKREKFLDSLSEEKEEEILLKLNQKTWSKLATNLSSKEKKEIAKNDISGLDFEEYFVRHYPEASVSAHLLGFVGKNDINEPTGYFGLEGFYDRELSGAEGILQQEKDALGRPILAGSTYEMLGKDGRTLTLHLERNVQFIVEKELKKAIKKYGAKSGEIVVMDPNTGGILAMSSLPSYNPEKYWKYETATYKNPTIANTYEPGSTFKVLVLAAALEEEAIKLDDKCDICSDPIKIGKFTIKTWDDKYRPDITPTETLIHSDNTGMVWIQKKLGGKKFEEYLKRFGFGEKTGIDLQEEVAAPLRKKWGKIDYATASFGQGIAVTSIQMIQAVSAIANGGKLLTPRVVKFVKDKEEVAIKPKIKHRVISKKTAEKVTETMVAAVEKGGAKWTRLKDYKIAGKTGTAQIPVAGHYDKEKTIASFVGFAPASNPRFVMLVKLREPTSSPWGSETAAPLFFQVAKKLLLHYQIPPGG